MSQPGDGGKAKMSGGAIASLVGIGALAIFVVQNTQDVTIQFLVWDFTWPLWLFTLIIAAIGAVVWFGLGVMRRHQRRKERRD